MTKDSLGDKTSLSPERITLITVAALVMPMLDVRINRDESYIERLAGDIGQRGIKHPIRVRQISDGRYEIVTGAYRYLAAKLAGLSEVPCIVVSGELSETDVLIEQVLENETRKNMSDVERGEAYLKLMRQMKLNQEQLAERLNLSPSAISKILKLVTSLDPEVRDQVQAGLIPYTAAAAIARVPDAEQQKTIAKRYADGLLSRDGVQLAVTNALPAKKAGRAKVRVKTPSGVEFAIPQMSPDELLRVVRSLQDAVRTLIRHGLSVESLPDLLKSSEGGAA